MVSQVIIHFIGLCLFTSEPANDPGLKVILPRVGGSVTTTTPGHNHDWVNLQAIAAQPVQVNRRDAAEAERFSQATPQARTAATRVQASAVNPAALPIEPHVAVLLFPDAVHPATARARSSWKAKRTSDPGSPTQLESLKGYSYVVLDGERIMFVTDSDANPSTALPPGNLPKLQTPADRQTAKYKLQPAFQFPYSGAAAIVDLPEGTLSACKVDSPDNKITGRVDTRLTLTMNRTLTVTAMLKGKLKTLVLEIPDQLTQTIYVGNVPSLWLKQMSTMNGHRAHYLEYYRMIGRDPQTAGMPEPEAGKTLDSCPVPAMAPRLTGGNGSEVRDVFANARRAQPLGLGSAAAGNAGSGMELLVANSECSNSAWP